MYGHDVGILDQFFVICIVFSAQCFDLFLAHEGIIACDLHANALADLCGLTANGPQTDDAHRFAFQLKCLVCTADLPVAFPGLHLTFVQVLGKRKHHGDRMLGHAAVVGARRDDDRDAKLRCFFHIHRIIANTGAADDLQVGAVFNGMCIALCNAHDQRIRVLHIVQIIIGIGIIFCNDLHLTIGICLELFDAFHADGLCHNKFHK